MNDYQLFGINGKEYRIRNAQVEMRRSPNGASEFIVFKTHDRVHVFAIRNIISWSYAVQNSVDDKVTAE